MKSKARDRTYVGGVKINNEHNWMTRQNQSPCTILKMFAFHSSWSPGDTSSSQSLAIAVSISGMSSFKRLHWSTWSAIPFLPGFMSPP